MRTIYVWEHSLKKKRKNETQNRANFEEVKLSTHDKQGQM